MKPKADMPFIGARTAESARAGRWLHELADHVDTYAVCAPTLRYPPPPTGPNYVDHILF